MTRTVCISRNRNPRPAFCNPISRLYRNYQYPRPLSIAAVGIQWWPINVLKVQLWWTFSLIEELCREGTRSPVSNASPKLRTGISFRTNVDLPLAVGSSSCSFPFNISRIEQYTCLRMFPYKHFGQSFSLLFVTSFAAWRATAPGLGLI